MNFSWPVLLVISFTKCTSQFVPDHDNHPDDLSFLEVAMDRGENAWLCDKLMRMVLLCNVILLAVLLMVWGLYGHVITDFYNRGEKFLNTVSPRGIVVSNPVTPRGAE